MRRQRRSNTRGFLHKCQPPACQGVPVATTDRSVKDAVPGPEDGKHQADYRQIRSTRSKKRTEQFSATYGGKRQWSHGSEEPIVPSHAWQNDVKASVNRTWQMSPLCHMLLLRSFVLDGTNNDASVVKTEKVFGTRQKARALTNSFRIMRKRVGNGATPASLEPRRVTFN